MNRQQRRKLQKSLQKGGMGYTRQFSSKRARDKFLSASAIRTGLFPVDSEATTEEYFDISSELEPYEAELSAEVDYEPTLILNPDEEPTEIMTRQEMFDLLGEDMTDEPSWEKSKKQTS